MNRFFICSNVQTYGSFLSHLQFQIYLNYFHIYNKILNILFIKIYKIIFTQRLYKKAYLINFSIKTMPMNLSKNITYFQAEPFIKNSHLITHLHIFKNQQIIVFTDNAIHIYSYQIMLKDQAAWVHIVDFENILNNSNNLQKQCSKNNVKQNQQPIFHMDEITSIFNNNPGVRNKHTSHDTQQRKSFGQHIFSNPNDISSNILLKGKYFVDRLLYLNQKRVKHVDISVHGDLLIIFFNGRAVLMLRDNNVPYYKSFKTIDLNIISKKKIQFSKFIHGTNNLLIFYSNQKIYFYNYLTQTQQCSIKYFAPSINDICGFSLKDNNNLSEQNIVLMIQYPSRLQFLSYRENKKKLNNVAELSLSQQNFCYNQEKFIQTVFLYPKLMKIYVSTATSIFKIDLNSILAHINVESEALNVTNFKIGRSRSKQSQKSSKSQLNRQSSVLFISVQLLKSFPPQSPQQMLHINDKGDYFPKQKIPSKQYINRLCQTSNGLYIGITCKKSGNYKQGQLLIGLPQNYYTQMIRKSLQQIKFMRKFELINFKDISFLTLNAKNINLKKETLQKVSRFVNETFTKFHENRGKNNSLDIQGVSINQSQFQIFALNIGFLFNSKQSIRHKKVQKRILSHFKSVKNQKNENSDQSIIQKSLSQKCIFTHKYINQQPHILECKMCDVYGIRSHPDNPQVWQDSMRNGYNRCYICLNSMKLIK